MSRHSGFPAYDAENERANVGNGGPHLCGGEPLRFGSKGWTHFGG
jgi:hypothetical protein